MVLALIGLCAMTASDVVVADFEGATYGAWTTAGTAFGAGPARGTLPDQMPVTGYHGQGLANSYMGGDAAIGTLTSPTFRVARRYLAFRIGGGRDMARLRLELLVNGRVVRFTTGLNDRPGGSEALQPRAWDLRSFRGKNAQIRIVDQATGGWGHISADDFRLTDQTPKDIVKDLSRTISITKPFLNIPIKDGASTKEVTMQVEGLPPVTNSMELAEGSEDWFATLDVSNWQGKRITIRLPGAPSDAKWLDHITLTDRVPGKEPIYGESGRGQIHFSPRRGWLNDPNGLVYYRGEYHLFFQHNPFGWGWGNMHWGHAVSKDLVHWSELPIALFPDASGTMFSGSAVVDHRNVSGLGKPGHPAVLLFYTAAGEPFTQGLAYSLDGRRFTKWSGNPIIPLIEHADRDPKVFFHEPTGKWVMVLYLEIPGRPTIQFLTSDNLFKWTPTSRLEGFHECPDLFELPIAGTHEKKWVITGASSDYQIGTFDGQTFHPDGPIQKGHRGAGFYAAQTYSDTPGRRIQIGWFQTETRGMPFNQSMSLPMELGLVRDAEGVHLTWTPVPELAQLRGERHELREGEPSDAEMAEVQLEAEGTGVFSVNLRGVEARFDFATQTVMVAGHSARVPLIAGKLKLRAYVDRTGIEVFAGDGRVFIPIPVMLAPANRSLTLKRVEGEVRFVRADFYPLRSAWR